MVFSRDADGSTTNNFIVYLGVHDRKTIDNGEARFQKLEKIIIHPKYRNVRGGYHSLGYIVNDIALLKLDREIIFDFYVRPICLPDRGNVVTIILLIRYISYLFVNLN